MTRISLRRIVFTSLVLVGFSVWPVLAADKNSDQRHRASLDVQMALAQGKEFLKKGEFASAIAILEKKIALIDGNQAYLLALRDAYRGYVGELENAGRSNEARRYRGFLEILDPAAATKSVAMTPETKNPPTTLTQNTPGQSPQPKLTNNPIEARGKIDDDPFSESNAAAYQARRLVQRAEDEYGRKLYQEANRHYAQAERLEPGSTSACQERWGYCKLYVIAESINKGEVKRSADTLEGEIRDVVRLAPKLDTFAGKILVSLREVQTDAGADVEVKHSKQNGWNVVETTNFRIYHTRSQADGEKYIRKAEATRIAMTKKWFDEEPRNWTPRCDIVIHPNGQAYAKATGAPERAPGHSTISLDAGRVVTRRIDLRGDDPNMMGGVLPHETTHVVLAGRFGTHHVPRWADEGMAVLSEPKERISMHLRNLPTHQRDGTLFKVGVLMQQKDYPEPRQIGAFYAGSVSVVDYLVSKKDAATFTRFLRAGLDGGYEQALQRYYGYRSFADLDQEWMTHAMGTEGVVSISQKKR